jgi:puromycin-sensitive aminopeptidase
MDSWIYQGGYPLVSVSISDDDRSLLLSQRRFLYAGGEGDERWQVPISLRYSIDGTVEGARVLLTEPSTTIDLPGPLDWVVVNDGAWGFYRVRYEATLLRQLTTVMLTELAPLERLGLVSDTWAAILAGHSLLSDFVQLTGLLQDENDPDVWGAVLGPLGLLDRVIDDTGRPALRSFVRNVVGPAFGRLGWDPTPGEPERLGTLRARLLLALGTLGADPEVRAEAARRHAAYLEDRTAIAPDLVTAVVTVMAQAGGEAEYEILLRQFRRAFTPQEEVRYLYALAASEVEPLLRRTLDMCLSGEVRTQDAPYLIGSILGSRAGYRVGWAFVTEHWEAILSRFPDNSIPRMLEGITGIIDPTLAPAIHQFLDSQPVPQGEKQIAQARERLDINIAFAQRVGASLAEELARS